MSAAPDQPYGAQTQQMNQQRIAPMAGTAPMPHPATPTPSGGGNAQQGAQMPQYHGQPFDRPSERPNEPTTHGVDIGPGGDSSVLNLPQPPSPAKGTGAMSALLQQYSSTDMTGILGQLAQMAQVRNA